VRRGPALETAAAAGDVLPPQPEEEAMTPISLPPDLAEFARGCVAAGRYADIAEVVQAALRLLQQREQKRADFVRMLEEAERDGEENGFLTIEEVDAELAALGERLDREEEAAARTA